MKLALSYSRYSSTILPSRASDRVRVGDVEAKRRDARNLNAPGSARGGVHPLGAALEQLRGELTDQPAVRAGHYGH
jgi:hypothetical protein